MEAEAEAEVVAEEDGEEGVLVEAEEEILVLEAEHPQVIIICA